MVAGVSMWGSWCCGCTLGGNFFFNSSRKRSTIQVGAKIGKSTRPVYWVLTMITHVDLGDFKAKIAPNKRRSSTTEPVSTHEINTNSVSACTNHFDPHLIDFSGKNGSIAPHPNGSNDNSLDQRDKDLLIGDTADKLVSSSIFSLPTLNFEYD